MNYIYHGPVSGVTLGKQGSSVSPGETRGKSEIMLSPGRPVDLPDDHPYVKTLVARGHLTPAPITVRQPVKAARKAKSVSEEAAFLQEKREEAHDAR